MTQPNTEQGRPTARERRLAVLGASGNVGHAIRDEALHRGHHVTGVVRDVARLPDVPGLDPVAADARDAEELARVLDGLPVVICALRWDQNDLDTVLQAVRQAAVSRFVVVVGAGSLVMPDGRLFYDHLLESGIDPPSSRAALAAYRRLQQVDDVDWTAVSPAAQILPGPRTGRFVLGRDEMVTDTAGVSRISQADFAVAVLDETDHPRHRRQRFTAAYGSDRGS